MSEPIPSDSPIITAVEIGLLIAGLFVLWRAQFSSTARPQRQAPFALSPWATSVVAFFQMAFCVIIGGWLAQVIASSLHPQAPGQATVENDTWVVLQGLLFQLGLLIGVVAALILNRSQTSPGAAPPQPVAPRSRHPLVAAAGTFLVAVSLVTFIAYGWKACLQSLGFDTREQDMVDVFRQANSAKELVILIVLAVVIAPLTEELIFRAGLFRFLRTRIPRWLALTAPAALFAVLHGNVMAFMPLFVLGVVFSLAYERTGRISVTIMAHGLFNLHTILLIMAGATG